MAALNLTVPTESGAAKTPAAAAEAGDSFPMTPNGIVVEFTNDDAAPRVVTIVGQQACNHGVVHDREVTIPAGAVRQVVILPTNQFRDTSGLVQLTYDAHENLFVAAWAR